MIWLLSLAFTVLTHLAAFGLGYVGGLIRAWAQDYGDAADYRFPEGHRIHGKAGDP